MAQLAIHFPRLLQPCDEIMNDGECATASEEGFRARRERSERTVLMGRREGHRTGYSRLSSLTKPFFFGCSILFRSSRSGGRVLSLLCACLVASGLCPFLYSARSHPRALVERTNAHLQPFRALRHPKDALCVFEYL